MATAHRTLVKSQPELWQLLDQHERLEGWSSGLLGRSAEVDVTGREPETRLAWEASAAEELASIELSLSKKGWGTNVSISAELDGRDPDWVEDWIEAVLDELSATEKRPFKGIV